MASDLTPVPDDLDFGVTIRGLVDSQKVFGRYTLRHVLGRGGMGVVWLARDEQLERDVALKFLPEIVNFDATALDDLKRETRRCLDLTHPNIIRIYDFVKDPQAAAISMEYIDGKTLAALRIEKEKRLFEVDEIRDWIAQVCQALYYAHTDVKVVHRDLKPANLMVTSRGQIKIADFGIARSVSDSVSQMTMKTGTSGTMVYMSPQQMNGDMAQVTDDIYALGATIYELLTTKPPFYSGDIPFQVRGTEPRRMGQRREEFGLEADPISDEWEDAVAACLAKTPDARPRDTLDLAQRLGFPSFGTISTSTAAPATSKSATAAGKTTGKTTKAPPKIKAPRQPFPTRLVLGSVGGVAALALVGWLLWSFVLWPLIATPGSLLVGSNPPGATVHVSGQQDQVAPAEFPKLHIGRYHVTISLAGYDPLDQTITVTEGAKLNLGTLELKKAFGKLNLVSIPPRARYTLTGLGPSTTGTTKEGTTPDFLTGLPSGLYHLIVTAPGLDPHDATIEIPAHDTLSENDDLVKLALAADAAPDVAKALLGQAAAPSDPKASAAYIALLQSAIGKYLAAGLISPAADAIARLKALGQDTAPLEKQLADARATLQKQTAARLGDLISDEKFASAQDLLDSLAGQMDPASLAALKTQFQPQLDSYNHQVDAAIQLSQSGDPAAGYAQLKTFAAPYPDDLKLQLGLAQAETRLPPSHDDLTARLKSFKTLAAANKAVVENADFQAMQDKFTHELNQLDDLAAALARAKGGAGSLQGQLESLQDEKAEIQRKSVGTEVARNLFNGLSRSFIGRDVITQDQKDEQIAEVNAKIANVQQEIAAQNSSASQDAVTRAQRNYDDFVAHVPW